MNNGINLLDPHNKTESVIASKRITAMRFTAIALLFIVSVSSIVLFIMVALSPLPELQRQEQSLRLTLSEQSTDIAKVAVLNDRANAIDSLLKERRSYEELLQLLQAKLPSNVSINALRVLDNSVQVTVESNSLSELDTFIAGLIQYINEKKAFSQLTLSNLSTDNVRNNYSMTINLVML